MGSHQVATKRGFDQNVVHNQVNAIMREEGEDGPETKHLKLELHPLRMGGILEKIFSFLDPSSLKNARQVNPLWSIEGAKILITKCYLKLPSNLQVENEPSSNKEIHEFKTFLSHKLSDYSMISNITIDKVDDAALWLSLGVLGPQVKAIKLNNFYKAAELLVGLFDNLPNLKLLSFKDFGYSPRIIRALISSFNANKIRNPLVVSFLTLEPKLMEELEDIENFAKCSKIFLTELKFNFPRVDARFPQIESRVVIMIAKFLIKNQNVLKSLSFNEGHHKTEVIKILSPAIATTKKKLVVPFMALEADHPEQLKYIEAFANCGNIVIEKLKFGSFSFAADDLNCKARVLNILRKILKANQNTIKILRFEDKHYKLEIMNLVTSVMSTAERNQNPLVIPRMTFDLDNSDHLEYIQKFPNCENLMIEELKVVFPQFYEPDFFLNILSKLLSTNQKTILSFKDENYRPDIINLITSAMSTADRNLPPLVISRMTFEPGNVQQLRDVVRFADCKNILIEELKIKINYDLLIKFKTRIPDIISKILSANRSILKKLYLFDCQFYLPHFNFPRMTKLTHMYFSFFPYISDYLPRGKLPLQFWGKFPNLLEISLDYVGLVQSPLCFKNLFDETATSVKCVKCFGFDLSDSSVDLLFTIFPGVEDLELLPDSWTETIFRSLWNHGRNLKKLNLTIHLDNRVGNFAGMDSIFTGFTPETVGKIKKVPNLDPDALEILRDSPSILNLKELERFSITFRGWELENFQKHLSKRTFLVAAKYGWNLLPKNPRIFMNVERYGQYPNEGFLEEVSKFPNVNVAKSFTGD